MADRPRVSLSPAALHLEVLQLWAELESRSVADVCLMLVESGLRAAARHQDMPQPCIDLLRSPPVRKPEA
jgi:hypothetical protein